MDFITVGTAGHVDHGKTSLVKFLTGVDTDRLDEEKRRGMTIDLGFANLPLNQNTTISFIDVPGHEKFLKNMLAGITGISFVLLIIAANEGIMPQTVEHLQILKLLNISKGAVILTKTDLVDSEFLDLVIEEINGMTKGSFLENCPLIKFSAISGEGREEILNLLGNIKDGFSTKNTGKVFFPIDRVFTKTGTGTIITGTLNSGIINKGDVLELMPSGKKVKIKQIQIHNKNTENVFAGTRAALSIPQLETTDAHRGFTLVSPGSYRHTDTIEVRLNIIPELLNEIKANTRVKFYHFCSETNGRISFMEQKNMMPGQLGFARIKLEKEITIPHNTAFVIRNYSPHFLIGGGNVLNPYPLKMKISASKCKEILRFYDTGEYFELGKYVLQDKSLFSLKIFEIDELQSMFPVENAEQVINSLISNSLIKPLGNNLFISTALFKNKYSEMLNYIELFHRENPWKIGISRTELQKSLKIDLLLLENFLHTLKEDYLTSFENLFYKKDHEIKFPGPEKTDIENILNILENKKFLDFKDLEIAVRIESGRLDELLKTLVFKKIIEELTEKVYVTQRVWNETVNEIKQLILKHGKLTTSQAREHLNTSRKYIIPILENMDKQKITRRINDHRVLFI
jgi:selenocysteine-specific elongation factor